jgi:hypothetical protein
MCIRRPISDVSDAAWQIQSKTIFPAMKQGSILGKEAENCAYLNQVDAASTLGFLFDKYVKSISVSLNRFRI